METGISTACLYPMETERALDLLLGLGFRRFEVFLNCESELQRPFLRELKARADEYGAVFTSVHPFTSAMESSLLFGDYPRRTAEAFAFYQRYCEAAAYLGGKYVVIHGQPLGHGALSDRGYWERFGQLTHFTRDTGARPAQENVRNMRASEPAFLRGMGEYLGEDCAFVLDVKQCRMMGHPVEEVARAMGDRLCHVHLSDCRAGRPCLLPGAGTFDLAGFRALLEELHYQGSVITEVYRDNFGGTGELEQAKQAVERAFRKGGC